jgi:hypothetical protein
MPPRDCAKPRDNQPGISLKATPRGLLFGRCQSHMIWRLIRSHISEASRTAARLGPGPVSSASSRTSSRTSSLPPGRQPAPAASAKRICVATQRGSANRSLPGFPTLSSDLARRSTSVPAERRSGVDLTKARKLHEAMRSSAVGHPRPFAGPRATERGDSQDALGTHL